MSHPMYRVLLFAAFKKRMELKKYRRYEWEHNPRSME